ncbi:MAG: General secretion pathway protein K [Syntrophorhabdus sp. PtaB.Bin184]|jgi:general secretion pathway protein K|nr:MAG: General secretion pathway protein K [Syntrophorhabdus sp. PtaB.Bin184]
MIRSRKGIALLMVLWVITMLTVLVISFSFLTRTQARSTIFFKEGTQKKFLAEAGIERAVMEIYHRQTFRNQTVIVEGNEVMRIDGRQYDGRIGQGRYDLRLLSESGKIDVNKMTDLAGITLKNLLVNTGTPDDQAAVIVDSILDWTDKDDLRRLNGAEDEYYLALPVPYRAKNRPFDAIEELLLVRGMTADILFGTGERKGIVHYLTIYGTSSKVNINAAPKEVLMALPGLNEDTVKRILNQREAAEFRSVQEIQAITGLNFPVLAQYIDMSETDIYTIESVGFQGDSKEGYGIRAIVSVPGTVPRFLYYKTPSEMRR